MGAPNQADQAVQQATAYPPAPMYPDAAAYPPSTGAALQAYPPPIASSAGAALQSYPPPIASSAGAAAAAYPPPIAPGAAAATAPQPYPAPAPPGAAEAPPVLYPAPIPGLDMRPPMAPPQPGQVRRHSGSAASRCPQPPPTACSNPALLCAVHCKACNGAASFVPLPLPTRAGRDWLSGHAAQQGQAGGGHRGRHRPGRGGLPHPFLLALRHPRLRRAGGAAQAVPGAQHHAGCKCAALCCAVANCCG